MKIKYKKSGKVGSSHEFSSHAAGPPEILVYFEEWIDTDFMHNYLVYIEAKQEWMEFSQAFGNKDLIIDNFNTIFFEPKNEEDKKRGCTY